MPGVMSGWHGRVPIDDMQCVVHAVGREVICNLHGLFVLMYITACRLGSGGHHHALNYHDRSDNRKYIPYLNWLDWLAG